MRELLVGLVVVVVVVFALAAWRRRGGRNGPSDAPYTAPSSDDGENRSG